MHRTHSLALRFQLCFLLLPNSGTTQVEILSDDTLSPLIISASRFEEKREGASVSATTISADEIQKTNLGIDKIIERTSGVAVVDGEIQIRGGSGWGYAAGSRTAVLLDGLPLLSGDAMRPTWGLMPSESIGQVEIIKGPASVQYGSSALSGILHSRSIWPGNKSFLRFNLSHGAFSYPQTEIARYWKSPLMESGFNLLFMKKFKQLDLVIGFTGRGADGYLGPVPDSTTGKIQHKYNPFTVDKYNASLGGRIRIAARYRWKKIEGLSTGIAVITRYHKSIGTLLWANDTTGLYQSYAGGTTPGEQFFLISDFWTDYKVSNTAKHEFKYRWMHTDNGFRNEQDSYSDTHWFDYSFHFKMDSLHLPGWKIIPGVFANTVNSKGGLYSAFDSLGQNTSSNVALFLQIEKKFREKFTTSTGIRFEQYSINGEIFSKPVFRIGANYRWSKNFFLRANYGQGYRFPTIGERYIKTQAGDFYIHPNPALLPESSESIELGAIKKWSCSKFNFDLDISAFHQNFNNYIEFNFGHWPSSNSAGFSKADLGFKTLNTGPAVVNGFESILNISQNRDSSSFNVSLGYTYSQPTAVDKDLNYAESPGSIIPSVTYSSTSSDTSKGILKYRIRHMVRLQAEWSYHKWSISPTLRYNSFMENIDVIFEDLDEADIVDSGIQKWRDQKNRGDLLIDLSVNYSISKHLNIAFFVFNVLNREYMSRPLQIEAGRFSQLRLTFELEGK